jgi:hypothetical protein
LIGRGECDEIPALANVQRQVSRRTKRHDEVDMRRSFLRTPPRSVLRRRRCGQTHEAVLELNNVAMGDTLEDRDLRLEVLQQLRRELAPNHRLDSDAVLRVLRPRQRTHELPNNNGVRRRRGETHDARPSEHSSERPSPDLLSDPIRSDTVLSLCVRAPPTAGTSGRLVIPPSVPVVR